MPTKEYQERYETDSPLKPAGSSTDNYNAKRPMTNEEKIDSLFTYHAPQSTQTLAQYETIRDAAKHLAKVIFKNTPPGSDQSAAIRLLREAVMTANAAIANGGMDF